MTQGLGTDFAQLLLHFSGKAAHSGVIEPVGNVALLGLLQAIDGSLLLAEIAFVLDFGFYGFEFVASGGN